MVFFSPCVYFDGGHLVEIKIPELLLFCACFHSPQRFSPTPRYSRYSLPLWPLAAIAFEMSSRQKRHWLLEPYSFSEFTCMRGISWGKCDAYHWMVTVPLGFTLCCFYPSRKSMNFFLKVSSLYCSASFRAFFSLQGYFSDDKEFNCLNDWRNDSPVSFMNRYPFSPSFTVSFNPPDAKAMTGTPYPIASTAQSQTLSSTEETRILLHFVILPWVYHRKYFPETWRWDLQRIWDILRLSQFQQYASWIFLYSRPQ